ncbi:hypothetical protein AVEN_94995-1 [Araneus ventricosus]|uniref:Uncharacterized protein n=1 Tax=Araneus ventricosus TaxID=182803 RepID=A0A4Y2SL73_ARAVE|nr:hypothetical protein AVEN_166166-1 [Araneus ventricosus]GBN88520.1 hypothetical protein AVEN_94995-1 [Araneus ventricosus]
MTRKVSDMAHLFSNFRTTPLVGLLTHYVRFNEHKTHINGGSSVDLGFEPGTLRSGAGILPTGYRCLPDTQGVSEFWKNGISTFTQNR